VHVVAGVHLANAGTAIDRRADRGVVELGARIVDGGLVALQLRGELRDERFLRVDGLLARKILRGKLVVAIEVAMRVGE
jgi:hypothetical protein